MTTTISSRLQSRRTITQRIGMGAIFLFSSRLFGKNALPTPTQVEGPFHPIQGQIDRDLDLTHVKGRSDVAVGEVILVRGQVFDTDKQPLANATIDIWQANHYGRYTHPGDRNTAPLDPGFQGWGLVDTDGQGRYTIKTIKPGPYPLAALGERGWRCRHIHFKVSHPQCSPLTTQMYFRGDPLIAQDFEIKKVPEKHRRMLIADAELDNKTGLPVYRFDLVLNSV